MAPYGTAEAVPFQDKDGPFHERDMPFSDGKIAL
jgi:hypothetical protein